MPRIARWKLWAAGVIAYGVLAVCGMPDAEARQEDKKGGKGDPPPAKGGTTATPAYFGIAACSAVSCHGGGKVPEWVEKDPLCVCNEAVTWKEADKHGLAFKNLSDVRGKQMSRILGYDVTKSKACLTCHAVWIEDEKVRARSEKIIADGVSCVACHGAYDDWVTDHASPTRGPKFRPLSRKVKWEKYGMKDLWDPVHRAELCTSCHVGNAAEGKVVTHDMYAAGHPILPGFELATFSNEMPRHWQNLREKKPAVAEELGYRKDELEETQLVLVGAAIALRDAMALIAADGKANPGLDLAHFDCLACHHDLKSPSWRQERGYGKGRPGRVPIRTWPAELARLAVKALPGGGADEAKKLDELLGAVHAAFDAQPFGKAKDAALAASELAAFADTLARKLNRPAVFKAKEARALLAEFPSILKPGRLMDFDQARQAAWAFEVIYNEATATKGIPKDEKASAALEGLAKPLGLRLPDRKRTLEAEYPDALKRMNSFDPRESLKLLSGLRLSKGG